MAVDQNVIKARLRVKYPKANLSKERIDELSARLCKLPEDGADEAAVDAVLESSNSIFSFEEIARNDDTIRTLKSKADNTKTAEELAAETKAKADAEAASQAQDGAPEWFKTYSADLSSKFDSLTNELNTIKTGKDKETKMQKLTAMFESHEVLKNLPEGIRNRALKTIDLDQDLDEQVSAVGTDFEGFVQSSIDSNDFAGAPNAGLPNGKPTEEELDSIIANAGR